jgi:glycosyltransferase involved in cell wall biosynthesis
VTGHGQVAVIPNGVDLEYYAPRSEPEDAAGLVFEGNMAFGPNVDAVLYFHRAIFPRIVARLPDATLTVVGKDPHPSIRALAGPRVRVTGTVEDVRPHVARAALFVCAMRKGAGIKNKILQAWAMGKAVVATPTSCGGLSYRDGENIRVAASPGAFSDAVVELLNDPERRRRLGREARATAEALYSWERRGTELEGRLDELVRSNGAAPRARSVGSAPGGSSIHA